MAEYMCSVRMIRVISYYALAANLPHLVPT